MKIEELIYGAWVLMRDDAERVPCTITGLEYNGTLYVTRNGESVATTLDGIIPLPIESSILIRFGFRQAKGDRVWLKQVGDIRLTVGLRLRHGIEEARRCAVSGRIACWNEEIRYVHELQRWWNDRVYFPYDMPLKLKIHE